MAVSMTVRMPEQYVTPLRQITHVLHQHCAEFESFGTHERSSGFSPSSTTHLSASVRAFASSTVERRGGIGSGLRATHKLRQYRSAGQLELRTVLAGLGQASGPRTSCVSTEAPASSNSARFATANITSPWPTTTSS